MTHPIHKRHRDMRPSATFLPSSMTSSRWRLKAIHRYLLGLFVVSTVITIMLLGSACSGFDRQCIFSPNPIPVYSNHRIAFRQSLHANLEPGNSLYQNNEEKYYHNVSSNIDSSKDNHLDLTDVKSAGGHIKDSSEVNRVLDSVDVDYSMMEDNDQGESEDKDNAKPIISISRKRSKPPISESLKLYSQKGLSLRSQFNCKKLFDGDLAEQAKVTRFTEKHNHTFPTLSYDVVPEMMSDCDAFKRARNYPTDNAVTQEERDFPIAYVILAHHDFEHVERLIRTLFTPHNVFCIHLDAKAPAALNKALNALASCFPGNVMMSSDPQRIVYAHASRLMADVSCMRDLVQQGKPWRYLINMAATELPLRSNLETVQVLKTFHGLNDIRENDKGKVEARWQFVYEVDENGRMKRKRERLPPPPHNMTVIKGLAYNTYSREFMDWAMTDQRALDLLEWSQLTFSPDEHYWATLNDLYHNSFLNTPGGFKGLPDLKGYVTKYIMWQGGTPQHKCQGRITHNICLLSALDLPVLVGKRELAVNKFDLSFDPVAYACMEEELENRTRDARPLDLTTYQRLYFIRFDPNKDLGETKENSVQDVEDANSAG